ncbi:MAG: adenylate cyclase [Verrucomicrobiota bacterium]|nr:adenylate cyclase [Verrucomicrobiota bacterium]
MGWEIERKWLLPEDARIPAGFLPDGEGTPIRQGYILTGPTGSLRVRSMGESCLLTVKRGQGVVRQEVEIELDPVQFASLWPLSEGVRLVKRRFVRHWGEWVCEIDCFDGPLAPLRMIEVEFPDVGSAEHFEAPDFWGAEVTHDPRYLNLNLAMRGLPR